MPWSLLPGRSFGRWVQFSPHRVCILDVRVLAALVATAQQQADRLARSRVVNAVARSEIDAQRQCVNCSIRGSRRGTRAQMQIWRQILKAKSEDAARWIV